ncbi:MAG: hypothetical protein HY685_01035 [Chloroflexi bacterium]|nr:hypothetical protein [Chloroflexota bacterium]
MNSSLIGKIEKARRYAEERGARIQFKEFAVRFRGEHGDYLVRLKDGAFHCECNFFQGWGTCSHTMAMERVLEGMMPEVQVASLSPGR